MNIEKKEYNLSKGLLLLLALAGGISVANLYYSQPLLEEIAKNFQISSHSAGLISTFTQLGYALGVFLFVPLGDIKDKRKIILTLVMLVTCSLMGVAFAKSLVALYLFSFTVGLSTGIPQIIVPLAAQLAEQRERGRVIGIITSSLLIGILLARTVSGTIGYIAGWRFMYIVAASLMFLLGVGLYIKLPSIKSTENLVYGKLLKSVFIIAGKYKELRKAALTGAVTFGAFSVLWTSLTFMLESPKYHMNSNQIGLFGLFGVVGALGARFIGKLNDKKDSRSIIITCILASIFSFVVLFLFSVNVIGIIIGIIILDFGAQGTQVTSQTVIYSLNDAERSRINTVFIVSNFIGGAIGSFLGSYAWNIFGWDGVCMVGIIMTSLAFLVNILSEK